MNRTLKEIALELLERYEHVQTSLINEVSSDIEGSKKRLHYEVGLYREAIDIASRRKAND